MEVNETKLRNHIGEEIHPAVITEKCGLTAGYIGPHNLTAECVRLFDNSLKGIDNLVCGANETGYHYTGLCMERDVQNVEYHDFSKIVEGVSVRIAENIPFGFPEELKWAISSSWEPSIPKQWI